MSLIISFKFFIYVYINPENLLKFIKTNIIREFFLEKIEYYLK